MSQDELRRALIEQARRYPGQENFVYEYYEKNPAALIELRAPIFEDKVIDHILEQAKPADKKVTRRGAAEAGGGATRTAPWHGHDHAHDHGTTMITTMITITTTITITTMSTITTMTMGTTMTTIMVTTADHDHGPEKK